MESGENLKVLKPEVAEVEKIRPSEFLTVYRNERPICPGTKYEIN
jgi:hypothetical protein